MATEIAESGRMVPAAFAERVQQIEAVVSQCGLAAIGELNVFEQTFALARGMQQLRDLITPEMMQDVMKLQGTKLGFTTDLDRDGKRYSVDVVKEVFIEATLRGFRMIGNEVVIIASGFYGAKNGFARKVNEFPGLTHLRCRYGVPKIVAENRAIVVASARWKLNGAPDELEEREIPIRINRGQSDDAILGKAERKLKAALLSQLTGTNFPDGDTEEDDGAIVTTATHVDETGDGAAGNGSKADDLASRLKKPDGASASAETGELAGDEQKSRVNSLVEQIDELQPGHGMTSFEKATGGCSDFDLMTTKQAADAIAYLTPLLDRMKKVQKPKGEPAGRGGGANPEI